MILKRSFDIVVSFSGLILLCPLLLTISFLIKLRMPKGSIFFKQVRIGQYGKLFTIIKFRTMNVNHNGNSISIKGENRITPLGSILRKYKLDELPELWNVLKGEMSLVGPRPDVPGYADKLTGEAKIILQLKPGITGPASIKYSNEEELLALKSDPIQFNNDVLWPDKVRINMAYYKNHNLFLDIKIILCTIFGRKFIDDRFA